MSDMQRDSVSLDYVGSRFSIIAGTMLHEINKEGYSKDWNNNDLNREISRLSFLQGALYRSMSLASDFNRLRIQTNDTIRIGQDYDRKHINGVNLASFQRDRVVIGGTELNLDGFEKDGCPEMDIIFFADADENLFALGQGYEGPSVVPIKGNLSESSSSQYLRNRVIMGATFNISSPEYTTLDLIPFVDRTSPALIVDAVDKEGVQNLAAYLDSGPNFRAKV